MSNRKRETDCRRRQVRFSFCLQKNVSDIMCHGEMIKLSTKKIVRREDKKYDNDS